MKSILLHTVPVIVLGLAAILGLTAEEQNAIAQGATAIIAAAFTIVPIIIHRIEQKKTRKIVK